MTDKHDKYIVSYKDAEVMHRIENYMAAYDGNDLLHDIELNFPKVSYRAFFLAARRTYGDIGARLVAMGEEEARLVAALRECRRT
jgi:hypothetical protein